MKAIVLMLPLIFLLACSKPKSDSLAPLTDKLNSLEKQNRELHAELTVIGLVIDSIDLSLTKDSRSYNSTSLVGRVRALKQSMEAKQKELKRVRNQANAYLMMMDALKSEAEIREALIENMNDSLSTNIVSKHVGPASSASF